jgi:hypothetical protein
VTQNIFSLSARNSCSSSSVVPEHETGKPGYYLCFHIIGRTLVRMSAAYVDDVIQAGSCGVKKEAIRLTKESFDVKDPVVLNMGV